MPHSLELVAFAWSDVGKVLAGMAAGAAIVAPGIAFARRARLELITDPYALWTRIESDGCVYVRELVHCSRWTRGAKGTRVMVEHYRRKGTHPFNATRLGGTPSLGWPSAQDGLDGAVTVHPGAARPIDVGALTRGSVRVQFADHRRSERPWHLHLTLAGGLALTDHRDVLPPGEWTIRLLVVADDARTRRYDLDVTWEGEAADAQAVLDSLAVDVTRV